MARSARNSIPLGSETYEVVPQAWPYLQHELTEFGLTLRDLESFDAFRNGDVAGAIEGLGERAHTLLTIFIPDLMPIHRWLGYRSAEAMEDGQYDPEAAKKAPSFAQIVDAFESVFRVNRLDVVQRLKGLFPMELIQQEIRIELANAMAGRPGPSESPTLPSPSGESDSRTPSEPSPTPEAPQAPESEGSPSPESRSSSAVASSV